MKDTSNESKLLNNPITAGDGKQIDGFKSVPKVLRDSGKSA